MNIKEQLEQWIERDGDKLPQFDTGYMDLQQAYKAGANEMLPLLMYQHEQFTKCITTLSDHGAITQQTVAILIVTYERQLTDMIQEKIKGE